MRQNSSVHGVWKDIQFCIILAGSTLFCQDVNQFNGEEGIATRTLRNALTHCRGKFCHQCSHELLCLDISKRSQSEHDEVLTSATPCWTTLHQLWTTEDDNQERGLSAWVHNMFDQIDQAITSPMQVFEDNDTRGLTGEQFDQKPPCRKNTLPITAFLLLHVQSS